MPIAGYVMLDEATGWVRQRSKASASLSDSIVGPAFTFQVSIPNTKNNYRNAYERNCKIKNPANN